MVPFLVGGNPAHFENVCRPFHNIGCTTLIRPQRLPGILPPIRSNTGTSLSEMCVISSLQCTGRGHAQNLFTSPFALFQCILHSQVSGLVPRYRTKSGVSSLIFPLQASPDRVFSHKEQRWWSEVYFHNVMHIELVTLRALASFSRTWISRHFFIPCPNKKC